MPEAATQTDPAEDTIQRLQQEHEGAHDAVCDKLAAVEKKLQEVLSIPATILMQELLERGDGGYMGRSDACQRIAEELVLATGVRKRPRVATDDTDGEVIGMGGLQ